MAGPTSRMLALLSLLQARRDWPGALLADRLEISARTVRRDVDRLRELGYRIRAFKGPDGGYRLDAGSELPPLLFDDGQAVALAVALQSASVGGGFEEDALRALTTVRQVMPERLRHRIDVLRITAVEAERGGAESPVDAQVLLTLAAAVRDQEVLRFDYGSPTAAGAAEDAAGPARRAEPHGLVSHAGRWYLVAWDLDRDDWSTFRVDRVRPRSHTGGTFTRRKIPGGDLAAFVSARFKGSRGGEGWPCEGSVVLRVAAREVIPYVRDGDVEPIGADRCRVRLGSWSWTSLAASFGRFDAAVDDAQPAALRDAFAALARRFEAASA
ncbi:MAG: WYL domain-containing protein [Microbacterium pygmaeum]